MDGEIKYDKNGNIHKGGFYKRNKNVPYIEQQAEKKKKNSQTTLEMK